MEVTKGGCRANNQKGSDSKRRTKGWGENRPKTPVSITRDQVVDSNFARLEDGVESVIDNVGTGTTASKRVVLDADTVDAIKGGAAVATAGVVLMRRPTTGKDKEKGHPLSSIVLTRLVNLPTSVSMRSPLLLAALARALVSVCLEDNSLRSVVSFLMALP